MYNQQLVFSPHKWVDQVMKIVISVLLMAGIGPIRVDWSGDLPITFQTIMILLPAILFGARTGGIAVLIYLGLIACDLPVRGGFVSGANALWGLNSGFFQGFLIAAILVGFLAERWRAKNWVKQGSLLLLGHVVILAAGLFWHWGMITPEDPMLMLRELGRAAILKVALGWLLLNILDRILLGRKRLDAPSAPSGDM